MNANCSGCPGDAANPEAGDEEEVYRGAKLFGSWCAAIGFCLLVWWAIWQFIGQPVVQALSEL